MKYILVNGSTVTNVIAASTGSLFLTMMLPQYDVIWGVPDNFGVSPGDSVDPMTGVFTFSNGNGTGAAPTAHKLKGGIGASTAVLG